MSLVAGTRLDRLVAILCLSGARPRNDARLRMTAGGPLTAAAETPFVLRRSCRAASSCT
jgi:hypothetical protein